MSRATTPRLKATSMHPRLSEEQLRAVASGHNRIFVEAAPGAGKTTVAADRFGVIRHGRTAPLDPPIVALSFTHSATQELRQRIVGRWRRASLEVRGAVRTIDSELVNLLEYLLRASHVTWLGGHTCLDPLDSWDGHRARSFRPDKALNWDFYDIGLNGRAVGTIKRKDRSVRFTFASKKAVEEVLHNGQCAHADVRRIMATALADPALRAILAEHLRSSRSHLVVDEIFDANDEDLALIELHCEAGIPVTVVGDYWQALYEFRTANPRRVRQRLDHLGFTTFPVLQSRRFDTDQTRMLADSARGNPTEPPPPGVDVEVVLAHWWSQLWDGPAWILPISLGQVGDQTQAMLTLFVDYLTRKHLGLGARSRADALRVLGIEADESDQWPGVFEAVSARLTDMSPGRATEGLKLLRSSAPDLGAQRRVSPLRDTNEDNAIKQMTWLAARVLHQGEFTLGLSVHQAKGREWRRVGVRLNANQEAALRAGLDADNDHHRTTYVALTRARELTCQIVDR